MSASALKVDPRKVRDFAALGLPEALLAKLKPRFNNPLPIQSKLLALNSSGISVFAKSIPRQGKTTASILGALSTPRHRSPLITNLVLVPTPALADQYRETFETLSGQNNEGFVTLYRTGNAEEDEDQHKTLLRALNKGELTSVIATPQRILDYITANPSILALQKLRQLIVDELDAFGSTRPLETLLDYLLRQPENDPIMTFMTTSLREFSRMPEILKQSSRQLFEVSEPEPSWDGKVHEHFNLDVASAPACVKAVKKVWSGPGLVVPAPELSSMKLQEQLNESGLEGAVVVQPSEVAGINIDNLENIYILDAKTHQNEHVYRLKWSMAGGNMHLLYKEGSPK